MAAQRILSTTIFDIVDIRVICAAFLPAVADTDVQNVDPFVIISAEGKDTRRTTCKRRTASPVWNEEFRFLKIPARIRLLIEVYHNHGPSNDHELLAFCELPMNVLSGRRQELLQLELIVKNKTTMNWTPAKQVGIESSTTLEISSHVQPSTPVQLLSSDDLTRCLQVFTRYMEAHGNRIDQPFMLAEMLHELGVIPTSMSDYLATYLVEGKLITWTDILTIMNEVKHRQMLSNEDVVESSTSSVWEALGGDRSLNGTLNATSLCSLGANTWGLNMTPLLPLTQDPLSFDDFKSILLLQKSDNNKTFSNNKSWNSIGRMAKQVTLEKMPFQQ